MKHLYLSQELALRTIAPVLQDVVGESVTEVLPVLEALFLEEPLPSGSVQEGIGQFVAARQLQSCRLPYSRFLLERCRECVG